GGRQERVAPARAPNAAHTNPAVFGGAAATRIPRSAAMKGPSEASVVLSTASPAETGRRPAEAPNAAAATGRLLSLDVFRGLTIAAMILVNNPGSHARVYWLLRHADWNGCMPADLIFPSFLFIVGVSIAFVLSARMEAG